MLDSDENRNYGSVRLSIAGNFAPHSNRVTFLVIYFVLEY